MRVALGVAIVGLLAFVGSGIAHAQSKPDKPAQPTGAAKAEAKAKPAAVESPKEHPASEVECAWIGKRITGLLARDDVQAANEFLKFYTMFHCPAPHLGLAFRCTVRDGNGGGADGAADRVERCWQDPTVRFFPNKLETPASKPQVKSPDKPAAAK